MIPAELPTWARTRIETYFGFQGLAYPSNLYDVWQFWNVDVATAIIGGNAILTETVFAVVKRYSDDQIYCFRITEESFEVSNIISI